MQTEKTPIALIVEDDYDISIVFSEALRAAGFEVEVARTGHAAMMRLEAAAPDMVVLDMNLPHVSGEDILHQIRSDKRLANTRVIVATANPSFDSRVRDQADLVLLKPVSFTQLCDLATRLRHAN